MDGKRELWLLSRAAPARDECAGILQVQIDNAAHATAIYCCFVESCALHETHRCKETRLQIPDDGAWGLKTPGPRFSFSRLE